MDRYDYTLSLQWSTMLDERNETKVVVSVHLHKGVQHPVRRSSKHSLSLFQQFTNTLSPLCHPFAQTNYVGQLLFSPFCPVTVIVAKPSLLMKFIGNFYRLFLMLNFLRLANFCNRLCIQSSEISLFNCRIRSLSVRRLSSAVKRLSSLICNTREGIWTQDLGMVFFVCKTSSLTYNNTFLEGRCIDS